MCDLKARDPLAGHKEAWLLGVGPGLDKWKHGKYGDFVLGINEVAGCRLCSAVIAWDLGPLRRLGELIRLESAFPIPPIVPNDVWTHAQSGGKDIRWVLRNGRYFERMEVAQAGWTPGTATVAIGLLGSRYCKRIHLVGFDSFWAWKRRRFEIDEKTLELPEDVLPHLGLSKAVQRVLEAVGPRDGPKESGGDDGYRRISMAMDRVATKLGVELVEG